MLPKEFCMMGVQPANLQEQAAATDFRDLLDEFINRLDKFREMHPGLGEIELDAAGLGVVLARFRDGIAGQEPGDQTAAPPEP
jgi:hypothetical protein